MGFHFPRPDNFAPAYAYPRPYGPTIPPYVGPRPGLGVPSGFAPWRSAAFGQPFPAGYGNAGPVGPLGHGGAPLIAQNAPLYTGPYTGWGWGYGASLRGYGPGFAATGSGTTGPSLGGFVPGFVTQPSPFRAGASSPGGYGQGTPEHTAYASTAHPEAHPQSVVYGPYSGVGSRHAVRSDFRIHDDIHERMTAHGNLDARGLTISVDHGVVTLNGVVPDRSHKRLAEDIVDVVPGVKDVVNHLSVQPQHFAQLARSAAG